MKSIPLCEPVIGDLEKEWIIKCLDSGFVSTAGSFVSEFEERFAQRVGARYAVATASGTAALHVSLHALGVGKDSQVFVPDLTFIASMNPALYCGARPVLVDVDSRQWCMDPHALEMACANLVKKRQGPCVIIPVHLYGYACDMEAINDIARQYDIGVVEDATEALGTSLQGKDVGTFGDVGCFSFNGNKMMTTGSGGMVVTDSLKLAEKIRYLVNQSRDSGDAYKHNELGFNYRMNNICAALGIAQLERLDEILHLKRCIGRKYEKAFKVSNDIHVHPHSSDVMNSYWLNSVLMNDEMAREKCLEDLKDCFVSARRFFEPLHCQSYVTSTVWTASPDSVDDKEYNSLTVSRRGLCLPSSASLSSSAQKHVIDCVLKSVYSSTGVSAAA